MKQLLSRSMAAAAAIVIVGALIGPSTALAASDHYFSGGLSPNRVYASYSAHTHVNYSQAIAQNTKCAAIAQGAAGYFYLFDPGTTVYYDSSRCTTGLANYSPPDFANSWHGAVFNPNASTNVSVTDAHYSW